MLYPSFFFNKPFVELKNKYKNLASLKEVAKVIGSKVPLLIEVKDYSIPISEIEGIIEQSEIDRIYLLALKYSYHLRENKLPKGWRRVLNARIFFPKIPLDKILKTKADIVELFPWSYTENNINQLRQHNIDIAFISGISGFNMSMMSVKKYVKLALKFKAYYISKHNFPELIGEVNRF